MLTKDRPFNYETIDYKYTKYPRRNQMTIKERRRFGPLCCQWLMDIDGIRRGEYCDFELDTTLYGKLSIIVYDDWIACRFDDPKQAFPVIGQSYSGKWNHWYFSVSDSRITADELLEYFKWQLAKVIDGLQTSA